MSSFKLVPQEPTDEMVVRGAEDISDTLRMFGIEILDDLHNATEIEQHVAESCFNAMVADAPVVEQEPAPDVAVLVEALEQCRFALEPYDDIKPRNWMTDREGLRRAHELARAALAAYRNGGEK